jgi:hypothetical protein
MMLTLKTQILPYLQEGDAQLGLGNGKELKTLKKVKFSLNQH